MKQSPPGEAAQLSEEVPLGSECVCRHMECRQCPAPVSQLLQLSPGRNSAVPLCCPLLGAAHLWDPPGEEVLQEELILLNLFCPQTMVRPLSCRQEGTSSPSPSSSLSKLAFLRGEDILKMRGFLRAKPF